MPVSDSPGRRHVAAGGVSRSRDEGTSIPLLYHHTRVTLEPMSLGLFPRVPSLICCPSHFLLSVSLHSEYLSKGLDLFFILILICSLTHQSSATLCLYVPYYLCHVSLKKPLTCRQDFLDPKPAVDTFSTPAPLPVQVLSQTG